MLRRYRDVLRHRDFRLLVLAFVVDSTGTWVASVVLTVYVFERTGALALSATMAAAAWVPGLLCAPLGGVIADRFERRRVMLASASASAVIAVGIVTVVAAQAPIWLLPVAAAAGAVVRSPYRPAAAAVTPSVVDEATLPVANGVFAALQNLVVLVGPAIGGLVLLLGTPVVGLALDVGTFVVAAVLAGMLRTRSRGSAGSGAGPFRSLAAGVEALRGSSVATVLLLFAGLDTVVAGAYPVTYLAISEHVGSGPQGYGSLLAAAALGGVLGAVLAERLGTRRGLAPVLMSAVVLQASPYAITPLVHSLWAAAGLQVLSGTGMVVVDVLALTGIQREVPLGRLSRVLGLLDAVLLIASLAGTFGASALLGAAPYAATLVLLGGGLSVLAVALLPLAAMADRRAAARSDALRPRVELLGRVALFANASEQMRERLAAAAEVTVLEVGDVLMQQGDRPGALWVLVDGRLSVTSSTTRAAASGGIPDVTAPDVVGEIGVLRDLPRTATVRAATSSVLWRIAAGDYLESLSLERVPLLMRGAPTVRLLRTHPELVDAAAPDGSTSGRSAR